MKLPFGFETKQQKHFARQLKQHGLARSASAKNSVASTRRTNSAVGGERGKNSAVGGWNRLPSAPSRKPFPSAPKHKPTVVRTAANDLKEREKQLKNYFKSLPTGNKKEAVALYMLMPSSDFKFNKYNSVTSLRKLYDGKGGPSMAYKHIKELKGRIL